MPTPITPPVSKSATADSYELIHIIDSPSGSVTASVSIFSENIDFILWEGEDYVEIGNWTQAQAEQRIQELIHERYP